MAILNVNDNVDRLKKIPHNEPNNWYKRQFLEVLTPKNAPPPQLFLEIIGHMVYSQILETPPRLIS